MASIPPIPLTLPDGAAITLRTATLADIPALIDYWDHITLSSPHNVSMPDEVERDHEKQRLKIQPLIEREGSLAILACDDTGRIIGDLHFRNADRRRIAHHGHFGLSVHADWRSRGVGTALIRTLLDWARQSPVVEQVCLGVFANNERAIRLYRRMGFVEIGRRPREFKLAPGRYIDDIQMMQFTKPESHFAAPSAPESTHAQ